MHSGFHSVGGISVQNADFNAANYATVSGGYPFHATDDSGFPKAVNSWMPTREENQYYESLFAACDVAGTKSVSGADAVKMFSLSGLPHPTLKLV
jgi:hypothetical protein